MNLFFPKKFIFVLSILSIINLIIFSFISLFITAGPHFDVKIVCLFINLSILAAYWIKKKKVYRALLGSTRSTNIIFLAHLVICLGQLISLITLFWDIKVGLVCLDPSTHSTSNLIPFFLSEVSNSGSQAEDFEQCFNTTQAYEVQYEPVLNEPQLDTVPSVNIGVVDTGHRVSLVPSVDIATQTEATMSTLSKCIWITSTIGVIYITYRYFSSIDSSVVTLTNSVIEAHSKIDSLKRVIEVKPPIVIDELNILKQQLQKSWDFQASFLALVTTPMLIYLKTHGNYYKDLQSWAVIMEIGGVKPSLRHLLAQNLYIHRYRVVVVNQVVNGVMHWFIS